MAETTTKRAPQLCGCGCGETCVTARATFVSGHDARLASRLVTAALAGDADAERELADRGWTGKLLTSRETAAKREVAKRERGLVLTKEQAAKLRAFLATVEVPAEIAELI